MGYLLIFVGVTAAAIVIQAGILVALFVAVRLPTLRLEVSPAKYKRTPTARSTPPGVGRTAAVVPHDRQDVSDATTVVRCEVERSDVTVTDIVDRTFCR